MIPFSESDIPIDVLEEIVTFGEGYKTEFQDTLPSIFEIAISLCAFTNTHGGKLFIGIDNSGIPVGVKDRNSELLKLEEALLLITPEPEISVQIVNYKKNELIYIEIKEGKSKPFYVRGYETKQAYIRSEDRNIPASKKTFKAFLRSGALSLRSKKFRKEDEKIVVELFDSQSQMGLTQIRELLHYSERRIRRIINSLIKCGLVVPSYSEKGVYYRTK